MTKKEAYRILGLDEHDKPNAEGLKEYKAWVENRLYNGHLPYGEDKELKANIKAIETLLG